MLTLYESEGNNGDNNGKVEKNELKNILDVREGIDREVAETVARVKA